MSDPVDFEKLDGLSASVGKFSREQNTVVAIYSGPIDRLEAWTLLDSIDEYASQEKTLLLVFSTLGGDPDAAYLLARGLKARFCKVHLALLGLCKSAGTLVAMGADEVIMAHDAELGPVDVQLAKEDDLVHRNSGLDTFLALQVLRREQFAIFEDAMMSIITRSGYLISTVRAMEIATGLATGIIGPIAQQLEPVKLGEIQRSLDIAAQYGRRLTIRPDILNKLLTGYPCHSFVIDYDEAKEMELDVRRPSETEQELLDTVWNTFGSMLFRNPSATTSTFVQCSDLFTDEDGTPDETPDNPAEANNNESATTGEPCGRESDESTGADLPVNSRDSEPSTESV